ncbi:MAG: decarboxylating 6-phosphogluconate dehydrogenase, partial [bacterium]|nr:decarboxylating 6-phosphogluconate dehydrogenase [bacterium]
MLFLSTEEVEAMWKFIDPIIRAWNKNAVSLEVYVPDTDGAAERSLTTEGVKAKTAKIKKEIALVGLGKMGMNMAIRLTGFGWRVFASDPDARARKDAEDRGITTTENLSELISKLEKPRVFWIMVPAGEAVDKVLFGKDGLASVLERGDTVIDGGNSFYEDSVRRAKKLKKLGINFLDVGVSGGPKGARDGSSLMIGGEKSAYEALQNLFQDLSVPRGYGYMGKSGSGHFVKMVHNGIEYGMMQSLAEGFAVLKKSPFRLNLKKVADIYNHGSVVESRLVGWLEGALKEFGEDLREVSGEVSHTGEGEWTVKIAKKLGVPVPVIQKSLDFRVQSKKKPSYAGKILTAL